MQKQSKLYEAFNNLNNLNIEDSTVKLLKKYVVVSKPIKSYNHNIKINNQSYSCYFQMGKLYGLPLDIYKNYNEDLLKNRFDQDYLTLLENNFSIMAHLALNAEMKSNFYGVNYSAKRLGFNNPPRGFFCNIK